MIIQYLRRTVKRLLDQRIRKALQKDAPEYNGLKFWLRVANGNVWNQDVCWKYALSDGYSLSDALLAHADVSMQYYRRTQQQRRRQRHLHAAQRALLNCYYLYRAQSVSVQPVPRGFWQKIAYYLTEFLAFFLGRIVTWMQLGALFTAPSLQEKPVRATLVGRVLQTQISPAPQHEVSPQLAEPLSAFTHNEAEHARIKQKLFLEKQ